MICLIAAAPGTGMEGENDSGAVSEGSEVSEGSCSSGESGDDEVPFDSLFVRKSLSVISHSSRADASRDVTRPLVQQAPVLVRFCRSNERRR